MYRLAVYAAAAAAFRGNEFDCHARRCDPALKNLTLDCDQGKQYLGLAACQLISCQQRWRSQRVRSLSRPLDERHTNINTP